MAYLFNRNISIHVGGLDISNLHVDFTVNKSIEATPNEASIKIYNLSEDNFVRIAKEHNTCVIRFSYADADLVTLYVGDIRKAVRDDTGNTDIVTSIECGDGEKNLRQGALNKVYEKGTEYSKIFNDIATDVGYTSGALRMDAKVIDERIVLTGDPMLKLNELSRDIDSKWSIQDSKLTVVGRKKTLIGGVHLNKHRGLLGKPRKELDGNISFTTLLDTNIVPATKIIFDDAAYKVETLTHIGSNHANDNYTQVTKAVPIKNNAATLRNDQQRYRSTS